MLKEEKLEENQKTNNQKVQRKNKGITLIALVITIVLNCSCLAMERIREIELKKKEISCII